MDAKVTTQVKKWVCFAKGTGSVINFEMFWAELMIFAA